MGIFDRVSAAAPKPAPALTEEQQAAQEAETKRNADLEARARQVLALESTGELQISGPDWNYRTAAAFLKSIGESAWRQAFTEEQGRPPRDQRGWPVEHLHGRLVSLEKFEQVSRAQVR